jgi:hypothetical protein
VGILHLIHLEELVGQTLAVAVDLEHTETAQEDKVGQE